MGTVRLELGDCLDVLKTMDESSVDSIVTDPPYELGFMGKEWDSTGIANNVELWRECLRVLKPGGHLLAFSGTRTYHRMASAIEDAGFEVRDMIEWVYSTGFPKSLNIGKAVDKLQGNEREVVGKDTKARSTNGKSALPTVGGNTVYESWNITKGTSEWEGWGTALKPAHEPICMARKPISEKTVAENCLKWGTGGINIDKSRVEIPENDKENYEFNNNGLSRMSRPEGDKLGQFDGGWKIDKTKRETPQGRFPANLIHDGSDEVVACFPETGKSKRAEVSNKGSIWGSENENKEVRGHDDNGGNASRFFKSIIYTAKASKKDRNEGCEELPLRSRPTMGNGIGGQPNQQIENNNNVHPTVKPTDLMRYLCRMVTPPGGTVLDPFMGSGSTGKAAALEGFSFIGIEREPEYMEIAKARIAAVPQALL